MKTFTCLLVCLVVTLMIPLALSAQMYILNEDFSTGAGANPPANWQNITNTGQPGALWRFDNPGNRIVNFPITSPFAILDAPMVSADTALEVIILESPGFDASVGSYCLLFFDHCFIPDSGATGKISAWNGTAWNEVASFDSATTVNPTHAVVDLTATCAGKTNARLRFEWHGHGKGYWALDNVRIYSPLQLDAGISAIDSPVMPFTSGTHDVKVTMNNFGYSTLTTTTIRWSLNGVNQDAFNWTGNLGYGQAENDIIIGNFNFLPAESYRIKVWSENPNGGTDLNHNNDTSQVLLYPSLCGSYTIGGINPDFMSFGKALEILHNGGVTCPVTFKVRNGTYNERIEVRQIPGSSIENLVTFESESGDSSQVIIHDALARPVVELLDSKYFNLKGLSISSTASDGNNHSIRISGNASDILISHCVLNATGYSSPGRIYISGNADRIAIRSNLLSGSANYGIEASSGGEISIVENQIEGGFGTGIRLDNVENASILSNEIQALYGISFYSVMHTNITGNHIPGQNGYNNIYGITIKNNYIDTITIENNLIENTLNGGITLEGSIYNYDHTGNFRIGGNRIYFRNEISGTAKAGIGLINSRNSSGIIFNNFIHATGVEEIAGMRIENSASQIELLCNSVNVTSTHPRSKALLVINSDSLFVRNNIFSNSGGGFAAFLQRRPLASSWDFNDYFSGSGKIGILADTVYQSMDSWRAALPGESNGKNSNPFFASATNLTPGQIVLDNAGIPLSAVPFDIDSVLRNPGSPDIGAIEFSPCVNDAGIDLVSAPGNPLPPGIQEVKVILRNQGTDSLFSAGISWQVNGISQPVYNWNGALAGGAGTEVAIGSFDFLSLTPYLIKAWSFNPNTTDDCNAINDTAATATLVPSLCGNYTIGGVNPDFETINEAISFLSEAGVTCPVVFKIRNGTYDEMIEIAGIPGASGINTVSFESESGDSSQVIVTSQQWGRIFSFNGASHVNLVRIRISGTRGLYIGNNSHDISVANCLFSMPDDIYGLNKIEMEGGANHITIKNNQIINMPARGIGVNLSGTGEISISGNNIQGGTRGISVYNSEVNTIINNALSGQNDMGINLARFRKCEVTGNRIDSCKSGIFVSLTWDVTLNDSISIVGNEIRTAATGLHIEGYYNTQGHTFLISGNRISGIRDKGIYCNYLKNKPSLIANNFIQTTGSAQTSGILTENCNSALTVAYNSINATGSNLRSGAFKVINSSNLSIRNNIFSNPGGGIAVLLDVVPNSSSWDFNDYYSATNKIGVLGDIPYSNLSAWKSAIGSDPNAKNVNPLFSSPVNPTPNQVQLNNSALPVPGILYDIDSTLRGTSTPDIGAKEFGLCQTDAGVEQVTSPASPLLPGLQPVKVILRNHGIAVLDSVFLHWEVNGILQPDYIWRGNLSSGQFAEIHLGDYNFPASGTSRVKIRTSNPNTVSDCNPWNDTIVSLNLYPPLCGTYTIGGSDPDFAGFGEPADFLNSGGVSCPVVFKVRNGSYNTQAEIQSIPGSSAINTVTFESESGDSSLVEIQNQEPNPIFYLTGAGHISFNKLYFRNISTSYTNTAIKLKIDNHAHHISVSNCLFSDVFPYNNGAFITADGHSTDIRIHANHLECPGYAWGISAGPAGLVEVSDNIINHPYYGINIYKVDTALIMDNRITNAGYDGMIVSQFKRANISGNTVINPATNGLSVSYGAYAAGLSDTVLISNNEITSAGTGIQLWAETLINYVSGKDTTCRSSWQLTGNRIISARNLGLQIQSNVHSGWVSNNFIETAGAATTTGVSMINSDHVQMAFNSVNITGSNAQSKGIEVTDSESLSFRNNIFSNPAGGFAAYLPTLPSSSSWDFDNYFSSANKTGYLAGSNYNSVASWGAVINGESNGKDLNPYFKVDTGYKINQRGLNGAGIPVSGIQTDIEGKIRNNYAPDIGAWEFMVDFGITDLLSPTLSCDHTNSDSLTIRIRQFGDIPFSGIKLAYSINNGPVISDSVAGTISNEMIYTFPQLINISSGGTYTIKCWLVNNMDDNISNDTLVVQRYTYPAPLVDFSMGNGCQGQPVQFSGNASIQPPYTIAGYHWVFDNGDTSAVPNPVHVYNAAGNYPVHCMAFSNMGCYRDTVKTISISPSYPVSVVISTQTNVLCTGASATLSAQVNNGGISPGYQWLVNDQMVSGATNSAFTLIPSDGDIVTCLVTSSIPCAMNNPATSDAVVFTVAMSNQAVGCTISASANPVCKGAMASFTAIPESGGNMPVYQWKVNGVNSGLNSHNFSYIPVAGDVVECVLTSDLSCVTGNPATSNPVTITQWPDPVPTITGPATVCLNSAGNLYYTEPSMTNYNWSLSGGTITAGGGLNDHTTTVTWHSAGNRSISVNYNGSHGCQATAPSTFPVVVTSGLAPGQAGNISGPTYIIYNQTKVFAIPSIPNVTSYVWQIPPGAILVSGANTSSVIVSFPSATATSGLITVYGTNSCGNGPASTQMITVGPFVPVVLSVINVNLTSGALKCYDATEILYIAGDGKYYNQYSGSSVTAICGKRIFIKPLTHIYPGAYFHGYISPTNQYCSTLPPAMVAVTDEEEEIPEVFNNSPSCNVYPNPTENILHVNFSESAGWGGRRIELYDLRGARMLIVDASVTLQNQISLANYPKGLYLLRIVTESGAQVMKIVKQ